MKRVLPILATMLLTSACGMIMSEEDGVEKPQDSAVTEFKVTEDLVDKPQEHVIAAETETAPPAEASAEVPMVAAAIDPIAVAVPTEEPRAFAVTEAPKEEMRAPVEPRQEDFISAPVAEAPAPAPVMAPQEFGQYKISQNETLMMAAFRIYGDYRKWKELKAWNKDALRHGIHTGMSLKYYVPEKNFVWEPNGLPYLVKTGNTLGSISSEKYGTSRKWKDLYENNRPLIRNPNVIFAGFTIYYVPARGIASQKK